MKPDAFNAFGKVKRAGDFFVYTRSGQYRKSVYDIVVKMCINEKQFHKLSLNS